MSEHRRNTEVARPASGLMALLRHTRYVLGENPVTAFAAGLFLLIVSRRRSARSSFPTTPTPPTPRWRSSRRRRRTGSAPTSSAATCSAA